MFYLLKGDCSSCSCRSDFRMVEAFGFGTAQPDPASLCRTQADANDWVAVKELKLSYYIGETLLFTMYTHYGNLI